MPARGWARLLGWAHPLPPLITTNRKAHTMKLYTRLNASGVVDEDFGEFEVDADGSIEVPDELGQRMHAAHIGGQQAWETEAERFGRLTSEELERRRDPAQLYDLLAGQATAVPAETDPDAVQAAVDAAVAKVAAEQTDAIDAAVAKALEEERARVAAEQATPAPAPATDPKKAAPAKKTAAK